MYDLESAWTWGRTLADEGYVVKIIAFNRHPPCWCCYQRLDPAAEGIWGQPTSGKIKKPIPGKGAMYWHRDGKRLRFGVSNGGK